MPKKTSNIKRDILSIYLALLFVSPISHAEIYKWVDTNGQTHYSEIKEDAGKTKAEVLKIQSQSTLMQEPTSSPQSWQAQEEEFKQRRVQRQIEQSYHPAFTKKPTSTSGRDQPETDTTRCNLARNILNGTARHRNGAPTDKNDREIAERDVSANCH